MIKRHGIGNRAVNAYTLAVNAHIGHGDLDKYTLARDGPVAYYFVATSTRIITEGRKGTFSL